MTDAEKVIKIRELYKSETGRKRTSAEGLPFSTEHYVDWLESKLIDSLTDKPVETCKWDCMPLMANGYDSGCNKKGNIDFKYCLYCGKPIERIGE